MNKTLVNRVVTLITAGLAALFAAIAASAATAVGGASLGAVDATAAPATGRVALTGHVLPALAAATRDVTTAKSLSETAPLTLTVVLNRSDPEGFAEYLKDVYDPASPTFRKFLTQAEIAGRFGPSQQAYDQVLAYLRSQNFTLSEGSANRMTLTVAGSRANAEEAFAVNIGNHELGGKSFFANQSNPSLPSAIAPHVFAIAGLSNLAKPQPSTQAVLAAFCGSVALLTSLVSYGGADAGNGKILLNINFWKCFNSGGKGPMYQQIPSKDPPPPAWQGVDGTGQTIGLLQFDTFRLSDVRDYLSSTEQPSALLGNISQVHVNGGFGAVPGVHQDEVLLDIANVISLASGANIVVYDGAFTGAGTSFQTMLNAMIGGGVNIISNSWSYCEDQTTLADVQGIESILQSAAASGISVFNASGDTGSTCLNGSANTVGVPASSPSATAVGGTTLQAGPGFTYGTEIWWDGSAHTPPTGQSGFGVSRFFPRPGYQDGLTSATMRSIPDVVANADPATGVMICAADLGGCPTGLLYGGTSASAPLWAAFAALLNQSQGQNLGAMNAALYPLANTTAFHTPTSLGSDFAHTGLGSPRLAHIHQSLTGQIAGAGSATVSVVQAYTETNFTIPPDMALPLLIPADGTSKTYVVVRLFDAFGNVVSGKTVSLSASVGSHAIITPTTGVTDVDNGSVIFTVTNLTVENVTFTATDLADGVVLSRTASVAFNPPFAASGNIIALTGSAAADGTSTDTLTVTLQDALGRPSPGKRVNMSQTGSSVIKGPTPSVTNVSGQIQFVVTNTRQENVVYTAFDVSDGDLRVPGSASVNFSAGGSENCGSTNFGDPNITAAAGYAMTPFATGFLPKNTNFGGVNYGCRGVSGIAFDAAGNLFAGDIHSGNIYKFGPTGGVAGAATLLTPTPLEPGMGGLTFGLDGKLYAASNSTTGNFFTGAVREVNPVTGAVVRTVAPSITCASYMATDPLSGDLFVDDSCNGGGSDNGSIWRINNPGSASPTTSVYAATPGVNGGVTFSTGGTLYVIDYLAGGVAKITGTNKPQPASLTVLPVSGIALKESIVALGVQPNGDAKTLVVGMTADASGFPSGIKAIDITGSPPTTAAMLINNAYANVQITGPDGCQYASMHVAVYKITNADGTCPLAIGSPSLALSPPSVTPNPAQGTAKSFTASFHYTTVPIGTPVVFMVFGANAQQKQVLTDATGKATFSYVGINVGADTISASAALASSTLRSNPATVTWANGVHTTSLDLNLSRPVALPVPAPRCRQHLLTYPSRQRSRLPGRACNLR